MGSVSYHITPLVINSLRDGHTQTNTHIDIHGQSNFKKPGARRPAGWHAPGLKINGSYSYQYTEYKHVASYSYA